MYARILIYSKTHQLINAVTAPLDGEPVTDYEFGQSIVEDHLALHGWRFIPRTTRVFEDTFDPSDLETLAKEALYFCDGSYRSGVERKEFFDRLIETLRKASKMTLSSQGPGYREYRLRTDKEDKL